MTGTIIHVPGKPLGRKLEHDPRSLRYLVQPLHADSPLISAKHHRHIPVLDQGDLGSCTGNAMTGALGTSPLYETIADALSNLGVYLDEAFAVNLYSEATALDAWPGTYPPDDTGSSGLAVAKAAQKHVLISGYTHATSLRAAQTALQTGPAIIGINWYEGFDNPKEDGSIVYSGSVRGGHEVVLDEIDVVKQGFWFTNSWGDGWGINGRAFMSFTIFAQLMDEDGDVTVPVPISAPAPVPTPDPTPVPTPSPTPDAPFLDAHPRLAARIDRQVAKGNYTSREQYVLHILDNYFHIVGDSSEWSTLLD